MNITIERQNFGSTLHGGQYAATGDGGTFPAWCVEQSQYLTIGAVIDYEVVDGIQAWGVPISDALDRLISWTVGHGWPTTTEQNDAIQTAIWSIIGGSQAPAEYLSGPVTQHAMLLHNSARQDLLFSVALGEPSPLPLLLLGLAAVAASLVMRRAP